jgi:hypothetical protein
VYKLDDHPEFGYFSKNISKTFLSRKMFKLLDTLIPSVIRTPVVNIYNKPVSKFKSG